MKRPMGSFVALSTPAMLLAAVFVVFPFVYGISVSFQRLQTILGAAQFVGITNYVEILASLRFWADVWHGALYASVAVMLQVLVGLLFALILNESFHGRGIARAVAIAPYVVPTVVGVQIFKFLLDSQTGLISGWTRAMGLHLDWFATPLWATISVILISVWLWSPFATIIILAGLQTVPAELHEAARIDGARILRRFWIITLPALAPMIAVAGLLRGVFMFNKFDIIFLATGGGPTQSTENVPVLAYLTSFASFDMGHGAAIAAANFMLVAVIAVFYIRATRMHEEA